MMGHHLLFLLCFSCAAVLSEDAHDIRKVQEYGLDASSKWGWHHHEGAGGGSNHSSTRGGNGAPANQTSASDSCAEHATCNSCNDASFCHWCDWDQACHVMGSVHGCLSGSSCSGPPAPKPPHPEDKNDTSCFSHKTCSDCALASHFCHWCGHDSSCHAIGSIHGCTVGVDCFSNDRCQRHASEPIRSVVFTQMGWGPFCIIVLLAALASCCVTGCWCLHAHLKGAYDDLAAAFVQGTTTATTGRGGPANAHRTALPPDAPSSMQHLLSTTASSQEEEEGEQEQDNHDDDEEEAAAQTGNNGVTNHVDEYVRLVEGSEHDDSSEPNHQHPSRGATAAASAAAAPATVSSLRLVHARRLYRACVFGNVLSLAAIAMTSLAAIRYYPKIPEYNICNDSVAWSSLMQSLSSLKATADFEILASVSNRNHFDIVLERGSKGTFYHNGVQVGTFDIPPVTASAVSITDVLVVAHLAPEKWEALSLAAEYYRGVLVLNVDVTAHIRIPALFNMAVTSSLQDIEVQVNALSDRHLCACEDWDSAKNHTTSHLLDTGAAGPPSLEVTPWLQSEGGPESDENESKVAFSDTEAKVM